MNVEAFLMLLTLLSTVTSLFTEALKKALDAGGEKYSSNVLVLISAIICGGGGTAAYYVFIGADFTVANVACAIGMIAANWIGATVGYDKVMQLISQIKK